MGIVGISEVEISLRQRWEFQCEKRGEGLSLGRPSGWKILQANVTLEEAATTGAEILVWSQPKRERERGRERERESARARDRERERERGLTPYRRRNPRPPPTHARTLLPPRTLQYAYAEGPMVVLWGLKFLMCEVGTPVGFEHGWGVA